MPPTTTSVLPTPPRAVLFDLDGTLCDSADGIATHLALALASCGLPVPDRAALRSCVGPRWEEGLPQVGVSTDRIGEVVAAYRTTYDAVAPSLAQPFDGVPTLLEHLTDAGITLAVATAKPHHLATRIVAEGPLHAWLDIVVGTDPDLGRTTKADVVGVALAAVSTTTDVDTATTVMVGDRHHDIHGAAAHGLAGIGVDWGCAEPGELVAAGAVAVAPTPAHLAQILLAG